MDPTGRRPTAVIFLRTARRTDAPRQHIENESILRETARTAHRASVSETLSCFEHAFERRARQLRIALRNLDLVDDLAGNQIFQRPGQMLRVDARHG